MEKCFSELERRIRTFNTDFVEKLNARLQQINFFRYKIVKTAENRMKYNFTIDLCPIIKIIKIINLNALQIKVLEKCRFWFDSAPYCEFCKIAFQEAVNSHISEIVNFYAFELFKNIDRIMDYVESALETAVTYKRITNDFGEGFLFSPQTMEVTENDVESYMNAEEKNMEQLSNIIRVSVLKCEKYSRIICVNRKIPTFDSGDREYDSWHELYLLQESDGIIRAVYCTGGYSIARIEGYAEVYQYPEYLEKYFN